MMRLPIGYDDFKEVIDKKLSFIDKTGFIKEILDDEENKAIVITRPRRFGKTLNLSLLHYFLAAEVYGQPTKDLFKGLQITRCAGNYMQHQGKYPVISVTFKDVKDATFEQTYKSLCMIIKNLYAEHRYLLDSPQLQEDEKAAYNTILKSDLAEMEAALVKFSFRNLSQYLYQHHGVKPWLLIDEYDTPIQEAYAKKYYDQMIEFMRGLLGSALKNNPYLNKAVITGILRVAKESLFSGVNNLKVYSILNSKYSEYFGFTEAEVDDILTQANLTAKAADIKHWYNGYQFGGTTIYNPWSIANCIKEHGATEPYWVNTSDNHLIKDLLKKSPLTFKTQFEALMRGETTGQLIDENMVFGDLEKNSAALWSLFLMSGYLTPVQCQSQWDGMLCQLRVPNQEVNNLYRTVVGLWLANGYGLLWYNQFTKALVSGNMAIFQADLEKVLEQIISCHDVAKEPEAFYHGLLLGFIASLQETHEIKSNRESGLGRYDIMLLPKDVSQLGIVIELKAKSRHEKSISLDALAEAALQQIEEKRYAVEFEPRGIKRVLKVAIAFHGKQVAVRYQL